MIIETLTYTRAVGENETGGRFAYRYEAFPGLAPDTAPCLSIPVGMSIPLKGKRLFLGDAHPYLDIVPQILFRHLRGEAVFLHHLHRVPDGIDEHPHIPALF